MKYFCVSDLHGKCDALKKALEEKDFNYNDAQHKLLVLGDVFDRGTQNIELWSYLKNIDEHDSLILIRGNHDNFFIDFLKLENEEKYLFNIEHNGFGETIQNFSKLNPIDLDSIKEAREVTISNYPDILSFFEKTKYFYETNNYIFVHAGINTELDDWRESTVKEFTWMKDFYEKEISNTNKTIVFGHVNTIKINKNLASLNVMESENSIWYGKQKIGIDGQAHKTSKVNVLILEDTI